MTLATEQHLPAFCAARPSQWLPAIASALAVCSYLLLPAPSWSAGTTVGTVVDSVAVVSFDIGGVDGSESSNTATFVVQERIDVAVTLQSNQQPVSSSQPDAALLFSVTNTGNGSEAVQLAIDSVLAGDDFDPVPAVPAIYFDTDGSGTFNNGDIAYQPGVNDPVLAADATIDVLLVNDIPATVADGQFGRSELAALAASGTGTPGTTLAGAGDGGVDAVIGASGGDDAVFGEYLVVDIDISVQKSVTISDPYGGAEPTVGATLTYSITVAVQNAGTAMASAITDPVPADTTYVANSIRLNGGALTDSGDGDAGEYNTTAGPAIVVQLGDLRASDGPQSIEFQVTIN